MSELSVSQKFQMIMLEPFHSRIHGCSVWVDENRDMYTISYSESGKFELSYNLHCENLTDGMIDVLYSEWKQKELMNKRMFSE